MQHRQLRMLEQHPWSCEPHHLNDLCPHNRAVAMHRAFCAYRLLSTKQAMAEPLPGVIGKPLAIAAQGPVSLMLCLAIQQNFFHCNFLSGNTSTCTPSLLSLRAKLLFLQVQLHYPDYS